MNARIQTALVALLFLVSGCPRQGAAPDAPALVDAGAEDAAAADAFVDRCEPGSTLGMSCTTTAGCSDGCYCDGVERCEAGRCVAGSAPCVEDEAECSTVMCDESRNRCDTLLDHSMCTNSDACDGEERCVAGMGCQAQPAPVCNDESACTVDSCDTATGCVYTPRDLDGDGYVSATCGGEDCDDDPRTGALVFPGATELCENRRDDDCDGQRDYLDTTCLPTNDRCDSATRIELGSTGGTYSGSTRGLGSNYSLACRPSTTAPDAVFRFTLTELRDVRVTASVAGAVTIRPFAQCSAGPDDRCNAGTPPSFLRRSLPPGEYAIIVSTSTAVAFELTVRVTEPTPTPPTELCGSGTTLLTEMGSVTGSLDLEDDHSLSCNAGSARDAVYAFEVPAGETRNVTASVTAVGGASWEPIAIALSRDCNSSSGQLACARTGRTTSVSARRLEAGRYYILVEGGAASITGYTLTYAITVPPPRVAGDLCSTAVPLEPSSVPGTASASIDATLLELDSGNSCGSRTSPNRDAMWTFTLTEPRDVLVTVRSSTGAQVWTALQTSCGDAASERRCTAGSGGATSQSYRSLPAGTYFVSAITAATSGTLAAEIAVSPATPVPMNDSCPGLALPLTGVMRRDTTLDFRDDLSITGCGTGLTDAVYTFTLTERRTIVFSARNVTSGQSVSAALLDACESGAARVCAPATTGLATITTTLDAGTYYVVVETTAAGRSDVDVTFAPPF